MVIRMGWGLGGAAHRFGRVPHPHYWPYRIGGPRSWPISSPAATRIEALDNDPISTLPGDLDEHEINRRLRAQYAEIAQLAGGLAHEIRNPLSTMH